MLTTTMQEMKNVIGTVRKSTGDKVPKLIVGGAPVTREFAVRTLKTNPVR